MSLSGVIELPVPLYSAVKVDGRKLYQYAREGKEIDVPLREMEFRDIQADFDEVGQDFPADSFLTVSMRCSKGSFVRSWAESLGTRLGCGATVAELRRTYSEPYSIDDAITLEKLEELWRQRSARDGQVLGCAWIPLKDALPAFRTLRIDGRDEALMRNGQVSGPLRMRLLAFADIAANERLPGVKIVSHESEDLVSMLIAEAGEFYKIRRVFHRA